MQARAPRLSVGFANELNSIGLQDMDDEKSPRRTWIRTRDYTESAMVYE